jgi:phage terminase small subunit
VTQTRRGLRIDLKKLGDDERRAVAEISEGANGIRIKFHDKVRALITLGQYLGIVVERHEHSGSIDAGDMSDEQLDRIIAAGEARKGAAPGTPAHAAVPAGGLVGP